LLCHCALEQGSTRPFDPKYEKTHLTRQLDLDLSWEPITVYRPYSLIIGRTVVHRP
jgi:hypothetical protein